MAAVAREVLKKIDGTEPKYESWYGEGKYWCTAMTVIATSEAETSGKREEASGMMANGREEAEEDAARALLEFLKKAHRFEIDHMNFIARTNNERYKERLQQDICVARSMFDSEVKKAKKLAQGWSKSLDDLSAVEEVCEEVCGNGLANVLTDYAAGSQTELIHDIYGLLDWTEGKIY